MLAPPALVYIWQPSVTPDQVWAARRFLPAVLPGLILLAFGLLCAVARDRDRPFLAERRFAVVVLAVMVAAAFPLYTIHERVADDGAARLVRHDHRRVHEDRPEGCGRHAPGVDGAESSVYLADPQTLRSFCDVPVVVLLGTPQPAQLQLLADTVARKGSTR